MTRSSQRSSSERSRRRPPRPRPGISRQISGKRKSMSAKFSFQCHKLWSRMKGVWGMTGVWDSKWRADNTSGNSGESDSNTSNNAYEQSSRGFQFSIIGGALVLQYLLAWCTSSDYQFAHDGLTDAEDILFDDLLPRDFVDERPSISEGKAFPTEAEVFTQNIIIAGSDNSHWRDSEWRNLFPRVLFAEAQTTRTATTTVFGATTSGMVKGTGFDNPFYQVRTVYTICVN
jgi:hypothetical protein